MSLFSWLPWLSLKTVCGNQNSSWAESRTDCTYSYWTHGRVPFHLGNDECWCPPELAKRLSEPLSRGKARGKLSAPPATQAQPAVRCGPPPAPAALQHRGQRPARPRRWRPFSTADSARAAPLAGLEPPVAAVAGGHRASPCALARRALCCLHVGPPLPQAPAKQPISARTEIALRVWISLKAWRNWGALGRTSFSAYMCLNCPYKIVSKNNRSPYKIYKTFPFASQWHH